MKKLLLPLLIGTALTINFAPAAHAGFFAVQKARIEKSREAKNTKAELRDLFVKQLEYTNNKNLDKLSSLYAETFVNNDGFDKKVYFKLVKDTWKNYPDIMYGTTIRDIQFDGDYAYVQAYETALSTTEETVGSSQAYGELTSEANTIYYLQKFGKEWKIISEQVLNEKSALKYGDARFIKMDLNTPEIVNAGQAYTASLDLELSEDEDAIASIDRQIIIHPQQQSEESFRQISDDNTLERMFYANKNNVNEYTTASVGIARSEIYDKTKVRVYVSGVAFLMTRVNVIPQNKHITLEEENEENAQQDK